MEFKTVLGNKTHGTGFVNFSKHSDIKPGDTIVIRKLTVDDTEIVTTEETIKKIIQTAPIIIKNKEDEDKELRKHMIAINKLENKK